MKPWDLAWWMAALAIAVPALLSIRSAVSKRQRELRGQLRAVLRDVSKACKNYEIKDWRQAASRAMLEAVEKLKIIEDEGIRSPSPRQIKELHLALYDLGTTQESRARFEAMRPAVLGPEQMADSMKAVAHRTEVNRRYVERLAECYRKATARMDNGNILTYWRYRLLPPFIVRR
ncbi:Uncharacterised protein [Mycobacteroides abscessus subsp. bolletii]|uniref:hypothetical protein n=1 Tax=Mycobacteroides abscessus TaxID=36809 RepID=UPI00092B6D0B|nr:hypothetical protein [Mycobacteroides abscessus]SHX33201.1 Uncharacterised protein [Mycobacteroides abscessus subsp. bolletii]SKP59159.1 Uncharacterised protein [Mycobacteroides abscessus subsp. bolletii]SKP80008.1 Uncharacterised protein [Mycobacteroides abscessus subsp. bolletii]SKQ35667.1 Uncharacterised protein [Mycobacteroides abscessus subsp. bolletii]